MKNKKTKFFTKLICWILVAMMLVSVATYAIYALLSIF